MDIIFFMFLLLLILIGLIREFHTKKPIWESGKILWEHSNLWLNMNTDMGKTILKIFNYNEDVLDKSTMKVPLWSLVLKSNFVLDSTILFISAMFSDDFWGIVYILFIFTISSTIMCLLIVPIIEYLIYKFITHKEKYIDNYVAVKVILGYLLIQIIPFFTTIYFNQFY